MAKEGYLYYREKNLDSIVRCYLTLKCSLRCSFCSAKVPYLSKESNARIIEPEQWAEGLNIRNRYTVLAGGEPFLYKYWPELISLILSNNQIK